MTIRIGNGAGFLGDNLDAPCRLVEAHATDYLTLEYLAELTLSILARVREKDPQAGYAADFLEVLGSLTPALSKQPQLKIVTNAGGMNPRCCTVAAARTLVSAGLPDVPMAVVSGDDLLAPLSSLQDAGCPFTTSTPVSRSPRCRLPSSARTRTWGLGRSSKGCAAARRIVITGRVADASLTVGPAVHEFGLGWNDWDRLAAMSVAGHLIECGAQATGAFYPHWSEIDLADVGYPIAELEPDGSFTITKPAGTGGRVNRETISEQLLYEIGDPAHYLTPDVDVDFTTVEIAETGPDRVLVRRRYGTIRDRHLQGFLGLSRGLHCGRPVAGLRPRLPGQRSRVCPSYF